MQATRLADHRQISGSIHSRALVVGALGLARTLAWGSSYYLPAILAGPISAGVGVPRSWVFGALSSALLIAAFAGPAVGRIVDRRGGRGVLSNIVLAAGLVALSAANGPIVLFAAGRFSVSEWRSDSTTPPLRRSARSMAATRAVRSPVLR